MKVTRKKVLASTSSVKIPAPFNKYYKLMSDSEFEDYTGVPAHPTPCEEAEGYNIESFSYAVAKPKYEDALSNNGLDIVELVKSDWNPNKLMLAYVVHDRIYPVDISEMPDGGVELVDASSAKFHDDIDLYDKDAMTQVIKNELNVNSNDARTIYKWYRTEGAFDDFSSTKEFIKFMKRDIYDMLDAADDQEQADRIREAIEGSCHLEVSKRIKASIDTGLQYWYLTKHGLGPGMIPDDVHVIDVVDDGWDTYVLIDKMLTTDELKYYDLKEKFPPEELTASNKVCSSSKSRSSIRSDECTKIKEDADSIHYIVGTDDDPDWMTDDEKAFFKEAEEDDVDQENPDWLIDYDLSYLDDPVSWRKEEAKRKARELADEEDYYDRLHGEGEYEGNPHDVYGSEEVVEEEEDFLEQPEQEFKSNKTAGNGKQGRLPAVFKKANIPERALVLDYGGGTSESEAVAQAYLDQFDAREMLFDPFNQTAEHNRNVVKELRSNGGADVAICSNVLNVIKEQEVRLDLLNKIKKLLKSGATAYISVYEGADKDRGVGKVTQNGESFQNNLKLESYLEEVQSVFPDATRKGSVIIAPNKGSAKKVESGTDITSIDLVKLESDIKAGCEEYLTGPEGGFSPSGSPKESKYDMNADEVYFVEVEPELEDNRIKVEVRAELSYEGMMQMSEILDKIVEKYDPDSYFDMVTSGIMEAYIYDNSIKGETIMAGPHDSWNEQMLREHDWNSINPDDDDDDDIALDLESTYIEYSFEMTIDVFEGGDWIESEGSESTFEDFEPDENGLITENQVENDSIDLINWNIPTNPGKYHVQGYIRLKYDPSEDTYGDPIYVCNMKGSRITDLEITPVGKVDTDTSNIESSTKVVASMSDAEVEDAILNGKPFELADFQRYWGESHEGELKAKEVEVGDVFKTNSSEMVDFGTEVKVLGINEPEVADDFFDYTFRCEIVKPGNDKSSSKVGEEQILYYDADEYVGELIPV